MKATNPLISCRRLKPNMDALPPVFLMGDPVSALCEP
jgi:hypothetical protein